MPLDLAVPAPDHESISPASLSFTADATPWPTEIEVRGRWSHRLGVDVSTRFRRQLRHRPRGVIIDLRGLVDPEGASLPLWLATRRVCSVMRPPVGLFLCLPKATALDRRLRRIDAGRLPRFTTMAEARAALSASFGSTPGRTETLIRGTTRSGDG